jgi:hypothetical protein
LQPLRRCYSKGMPTKRIKHKAAEPENTAVTVTMAALLSALERAEQYAAEHRAHDKKWGGDEWQAAALECLMLPGVWDALRRARPGHSVEHWRIWKGTYTAMTVGLSPFLDLEGNILPGLPGKESVLPGYRLAPSPEMDPDKPGILWCDYTHAGTAWDGVRREIDGTLGYELQSLAHELRRRLRAIGGLEQDSRDMRTPYNSPPEPMRLELERFHQALNSYGLVLDSRVPLIGDNGGLQDWIRIEHAEALVAGGARGCADAACEQAIGLVHVHKVPYEAPEQPVRTPQLVDGRVVWMSANDAGPVKLGARAGSWGAHCDVATVTAWLLPQPLQPPLANPAR